MTRVGKHSGEALTCTAFSVKSQRLLFTLFYCGLVRSLYKWPVDSSALSWESLIEHLINCRRYIFQAQDRDKHTRYDELEPELKFGGSKWNSQAHGGDAANIWSQGNTPPPPPLTPSPMPGVEDGFLILSFPASLPTYFCSSTYPLFTLPQEGSSYHQKWRWLGAQCPGCLKYQSVFKEDPERSLLFPPAFWICIVSRPRQVSLSPAYVSSPLSLNLSLSHPFLYLPLSIQLEILDSGEKEWCLWFNQWACFEREE